MSVLALVTKTEEVELVIPWALQFARARETTLTVLCWARSPIEKYPLLSAEAALTDALVERAQSVVEQQESPERLPDRCLGAENVNIRRALHPNPVKATLEQVRAEKPELVVAAGQDASGQTGATYATNPLLRGSPCNTVILFAGAGRSSQTSRLMVGITDSGHDVAAVSLAARLSSKCQTKVAIARAEKGDEEEMLEVGRRELKQLMRDAGLKRNDRIQRHVFSSDAPDTIVAAMNKQDLVLIGANNQQVVQQLLARTDHPVVGVIKRSPPLRPWQRGRRGVQWNPRLSPADYADLVQGLRIGSRLNTDFLTMLGLAAAIASLGLLQDSPAVVIGSMLLAPLMTPMLGAGLALAQANPKLGNTALRSIFYGFLLTLAVSYAIGWITPGEEMTVQILARGEPNLLDLAIALFSAAAAAYALARPNLVGAIAGVAIATALVPPLCCAGVSLAYRQYPNAAGAGVLFVTNLVAIILSAAGTFHLLGVMSTRANTTQRRWVLRIVTLLVLTVLALAYPLERSLEESIDQGKPQPNSYPLTQAVAEAVEHYVRTLPDVRIVASGRPSSVHAAADVQIFLSSPRLMPHEYADRITAIVRREMNDPELAVHVFGLKNEWQQEE